MVINSCPSQSFSINSVINELQTCSEIKTPSNCQLLPRKLPHANVAELPKVIYGECV